MKSTHDDIINALTGICGEDGVLTDEAASAPYLTDWRGDYTGKALAIVRPRVADEVAGVVRLAAEHKLPVVPHGGNTGLCGAATPDEAGNAIVVACGRMNRIIDINTKSRVMVVEAGCVLENIRAAAAEKDLFFPLDIGSRGSCQIGGNLATNAGGLNVLRYGNARALCAGIEVVLADGTVLDLMSSVKKDNTGYDLKDLFIGSEGTLGIITKAALRLFDSHKATATAFAGTDDIESAIALLNLSQEQSGGQVTAFEIMPEIIVSYTHECFPELKPPFGKTYPFSVLVEIASTAAGDDARMNALMESIMGIAAERGLIKDAVIAASTAQARELFAIRENIPESEKRFGAAYKSDISVPIEHIPRFYAEAAAAADALAPGVRAFGFGHLGDGNLHYNLCIPEGGHADFPALYPQFDSMLVALLKKYGGSISAEHGIGRKKRAMLKASKDENALALMRKIKQSFDPAGIMNPGNILE